MNKDGIYNLLNQHVVDQHEVTTCYLDTIIYNRQLKRENVIDHILEDKELRNDILDSSTNKYDTLESKLFSKKFLLKKLDNNIDNKVYDYFNKIINNTQITSTPNSVNLSYDDKSNYVFRKIHIKNLQLIQSSRLNTNDFKIVCGYDIFDYLTNNINSSNPYKFNGIDLYVDYKIDANSVIITCVKNNNGGFMLFLNEDRDYYCIDSTPNIDKLYRVIRFDI